MSLQSFLLITLGIVLCFFVYSSESRILSGLSITEPKFLRNMYIPISQAQFSTVKGVSGELVLATPIIGCQPLTNPSEIKGKIAFLHRGSCDFYLKAKHAWEAGAIGFVISNVLDEDLPSPAWSAIPGMNQEIEISGGLIHGNDGNLMETIMKEGKVVAISIAGVEFIN